MKTINKLFLNLLFLVAVLLATGCKKFVQIDPPEDQIISTTVYTNDELALSAIRGIYAQMMTSSGFASGSSGSVTLLAGRSADEFTNYNVGLTYVEFFTNSLSPNNTTLRTGLWQEPYKYIYFANLLLENLTRSDKVTLPVKRQLEGEAKFVRAFCHFYLTNLFGNIPIILTTDYNKNAVAFASKSSDVYNQVIKDLLDARELLSEEYPTSSRTRPNKWAAAALLSRAYLYKKDWIRAEIYSTEVIHQESTYRIMDDLNEVFLTTSREAILQLITPLNSGLNTKEGSLFILTAAPGTSTHVTLSENLIKAFEVSDRRLIKWVGTFTNSTGSWKYANKYKIKTGNATVSEYSMVLRLAELFLIRAEARAMQDNIENARKDLNKIRNRAGLIDVSYTDQSELVAAIQRERRLELFAEWGHRWLDLKRTGTASTILGPLKSPDWENTDILYPIPQSDIINNGNLTQNDGY